MKGHKMFEGLESGLYYYFNLRLDSPVEGIVITEDDNDKDRYMIELECVHGIDEYKKIIAICHDLFNTRMIYLWYEADLDDLYVYCKMIEKKTIKDLYNVLNAKGITVKIPRNLNIV